MKLAATGQVMRATALVAVPSPPLGFSGSAQSLNSRSTNWSKLIKFSIREMFYPKSRQCTGKSRMVDREVAGCSSMWKSTATAFTPVLDR